jgi:3-hydroxyisobutyrate dehydrogenase-like beta-hydroxyacid dehydrogenase
MSQTDKMTGSYDHTISPARPEATEAVAVLGCGNMGSAFVRALITAGRRVAVWNRTVERAEALARHGADVRTSAEGAMTAAPVVIPCLGSTDDVRKVLDTVAPERLTGRTILNVTSGTPEHARTMRDWAREHGIDYLDAAIGAYPEQIGTHDARILVSGDEALWRANRDVVCDLAGSSMYVGDDPGAANAIDAALTGAFYISSLVSFLEAARFTSGFGVSHEVLSDLAEYSVSVLNGELKHVLGRIVAGDFATEEATLNVYADAAATFAATLNERGASPMIQATAQTLRRGVDAGLGDDDISAIVTLDS